ncbi:MAG: hypothetical protein HIU84_01385 [Acidobacteria bacterium]|nr:hypothetical protein [Acidobacteriota bacterium]
MLEESLGVKEHRACRVIGQHRSAQRLEVSLPSDGEKELRAGSWRSPKSIRAGVGNGPISTDVVRDTA